MRRRILLFIFIIGLTLRFFPIENVLVLNSYHAGFEWTENELEGFLSVFVQNEGFPEFYYQFMDTKRYNEENYFTVLEDYYKKKFASGEFDAVVVTDDDALTFILDNHLDFRNGIPLVFMGVSNKRDYPSYSEYLISGVEESVDIENTLKCALNMFGETEKILFIADDKTTTGKEYISMVKSIMQKFKNLDFEIISDTTYGDLLSETEKTGKRDIILFMSFAEDKNGDYYSDTETIRDICEVSASPVFVVVEELVGSGAVGGKVISALEMGKHAGGILKKILDGNDPEDIGIMREEATVYLFDYSALRKYGVDMGALPSDSVVLNKSESIWEIQGVYLYSIIAVFAAMACILFFSLVQAKQKKKYSQLIANRSLEIEESIYKLEMTVRKSDALNRESLELNRKLQNVIDLMGYISISMDLREFYGKIIENMSGLFSESDYICFLVYEDDGAYLIDSEKNYIEFRVDFNSVNRKMECVSSIFGDEEADEVLEFLPSGIGEHLKEKFESANSVIKKNINIEKNSVLIMVFNTSKMNLKFSGISMEVLDSISILVKNYLKDRMELTEIRKSFLGFASKLSLIAESKNEIKGFFSERVSGLSGLMAEKLNMDKSLVEEIKKFSPLYDIGKVFVPPKILNKSTPLNEKEWEIIKKHTVNSLKVLKGSHFELARMMALYHHERYDGSGYPLGISGDDIPMPAQIIGIVDTYITLRVLRSKSHSEAMDEIISEGGQHKFNPVLIRILLDSADEIEARFDEF